MYYFGRRRKSSSAVWRSSGACGGAGLITRLRMVIAGDFSLGEHDSILSGPYDGRLPTRCAFQMSALDGSEQVFPLEYVMLMMSDWARKKPCDPYIKIQNTGVSVLIQGFFNPPIGAKKQTISSETPNVILRTTQYTGLSLSDISALKTEFGVDTRPFQACLCFSCFVRLPDVQVAFRFMGSNDPDRTIRLLEAAQESYLDKGPRLYQGQEIETDNIQGSCMDSDTESLDFVIPKDQRRRLHRSGIKRTCDEETPSAPNVSYSFSSTHEKRKCDRVQCNGFLGKYFFGPLSNIFRRTDNDCNDMKNDQKDGGAISHVKMTIFITSVVTLVTWFSVWCIKDAFKL